MKKIIIVLLGILLPMICFAQSTVSQTESATQCFVNGNVCYDEKDYKKAVEWYQKGANKGHARSQFRLGWMYRNGFGVTQDNVKAAEWYEKAAIQGEASAQGSLAIMYENGYGVQQDYAKAVEWYQKAANQGNAVCQSNLGYMYAKGYGVQQDYAKAVEWYQKAANQGNAKAQNNLGELYETMKEYTKAVEWYQKAANQGNAKAQTNIATMCEYGLGITKDSEKAAEWFQKAASQGDARAQYNLGIKYENGYGVTKDYAKAFEWYQKAANQGYLSALYTLGMIYLEGELVTKDYAKAVEWFQKAAVQGHAKAQNNLGYLYENGCGVTKDYSKALEWYQKAANQGNEKAKENISSLQIKIEGEKNTLAQSPNAHETVKDAKSELGSVDNDIPVINRVNRNTFALIFANENYTRETKVDYARNDGVVFRDYCRKTLGLPEKNVHYIADATLNDLIGELDWLQQVCKAYKGEASIIFYYAGHGIPDEASGSSYLLPTDGNSRILRTCFGIDELYKTLGSMPTKKVTVLMDACFSGAKRSGGMLAAARGVAIKAKAAAPKGNMVVLSAAQGDETAYKYEDVKHGLFTYFLLKKLKETKGNVTMGELSNYLKDQVGRYSIVENGKSQTPSVMISDNLRSSWEELKFY